jgi:uncharacterized membrane protein
METPAADSKPSGRPPARAAFGIERCQSLTDGVIAIVVTLLVLGIEVPTNHEFSKQGLREFLKKMGFDLMVYAVGFWLGGTYWVQFSAMMHYLKRGSRPLVWLTLLFLLNVTLLPLVTKLKSVYRLEPLVTTLFGAVQIAVGLSLIGLWAFIVAHPEMTGGPLPADVRRSMYLRMFISPVLISLVAIPISFYDVHLGTLFFLTVPIYYFSHRIVDSRWLPQENPEN